MASPQETDAVVNEVLAGRRSAYRQIIEAYEPRVRAILAAIGPNADFVENMCQEVFIRAYTSLPRYVPGGDFGKWIAGIARNVARQEIRHQMREAKRMKDYRTQLDLFACESETDAPERDDEEDRLDRLRDCLNQLPANQSSLIRAYYFDRIPSDALVRRLNRTVNWLRVTLHRIKKALLHCLEAKVSA